MSELTLRLLTPDLLPAWLAFFDGPAFADHPEWGTCFCRCMLFGGRGVEAWDAACRTGENRGAMADAIAAGRVDGVMAFRGDEPVGWLQFGPAPRFASPIGTRWGEDPAEGAVVCFLVAQAHRRSGVSRALLRRACDEMAAHGMTTVRALAALELESAAEQFTGPLGLYLSEGFVPTEVAAAGARRVRVARKLSA